jgi:chromosome partitioning protein
VPSAQKYGQLSLTNELKNWSKKYDNVFVDAGGYDSEELRSSVIAADRFYIPIRPAQFDLWTLPKIIQIAKQSQVYNPGLEFFFVINSAHTSRNVKQVEEVLTLAKEIEDMTFCQTIIHSRLAFAKAPVAGMAVTEMKGPDYDRKAAEEMMSLYEEIFNG